MTALATTIATAPVEPAEAVAHVWTTLPDLRLEGDAGEPSRIASGPRWQNAVNRIEKAMPAYRRDDIAAAIVTAYVARLDENRIASLPASLSPLGECTAIEVPLHEDDTLVRFAGRVMETAVLRDAGRRGTRVAASPDAPLAVVKGPGATPAALTFCAAPRGDYVIQARGDVPRATVERLDARLAAIAERIAERPDVALAKVPLAGDAERALVVDTWNRTGRDYAYAGGLVARMKERALEAPDHPALICGGETLDYATFEKRVDTLARLLRARGVGPDTFVGLFMERSFELVIGMWAVLRAGGAYVPLNTEDPKARVLEIIADCAPKVVLTQPALAERLHGCGEIVCELPPGGATYDDGGSVALPMPDAGDLAYMIYTSGSTGKPKGVVVEHGAIFNRVQWMHDEYGLTPADRVLQKTPYTFDVSVWEFLWPLAMGSTMVLAEPGGHTAIGYLARLIRDEGVTHLHFVPSVLRLFTLAPKLDELPIKKLFCSGEALPFDLVERFYAKAGEQAEVHNLYGPTEAAVDVSYFHCPREPDSREIPIGRPVSNTALYVLDENGDPAPVGVPGELMIAGVQLARGYWARPDITAERFVDCPLADAPWDRMYRTGDLAYFRPDGQIMYLGRNDFQVKINGVRIELGEIEAAIRDDEAVEDVIVVAEETNGSKALVAYVVANEPGAVTADRLKGRVGAQCPSTYVPQEVRFLAAMPLNVSGKTDRKALATTQRVGG